MNTLTVTSDVKGTVKQLHFNMWDSARNELHFLDIGILCKNDKCNLNEEESAFIKSKVKAMD